MATKNCKKGAACGNSCISKTKKCRKIISQAMATTLSALSASLNKKDYKNEIGSGAFGEVFSDGKGKVLKVENLSNAVKEMEYTEAAKSGLKIATTDELAAHYELSMSLQQKAAEAGIAPKVLASKRDGDTFKVAMEELEGYKTLNDIFQPRNANGDIDRNAISPFATKAANTKAMENLQNAFDKMKSLDISHNDLHDGNIMINPKTLDVKFIDFGFSSKKSELNGQDEKNIKLAIRDINWELK